MKILIVSSYFHPYLSGLTLYPLRLAREWKKQGHEISVLTFKHDEKLKSHEVFEGMHIERLTPHLKLSKGLINLAFPFVAFKAIRKSSVVIVNLPSSTENVWTSLLTKLLGKKTLVLYHCDVTLTNSWFGRLASLLTNACSFWSCLLADKIASGSEDYAKTSPVLRPFLRKVIFSFPRVEKKKLSREFSQKLKRFYGKSSPVIGFVGRISQEKNLEVLISALDILYQKWPKLKLLLVGPFAYQVVGESKYYLKILRLLEEYGFNYEILGILKNEELGSFFDFIDLLVLPSNNRTESFGMTQVEAMLQGTPVVTADAPGIRIPVSLTKMGLLFDSNNSQDLAKKIETVIENKKRFRGNRKEVEALFLKPQPLLP